MVVLEKRKLEVFTVNSKTIYLQDESGNHLDFIMTNEPVPNKVIFKNEIFKTKNIGDNSFKAIKVDKVLKKVKTKSVYLEKIIKNINTDIYKIEKLNNKN
jgi:hypothetical protein